MPQLTIGTVVESGGTGSCAMDLLQLPNYPMCGWPANDGTKRSNELKPSHLITTCVPFALLNTLSHVIAQDDLPAFSAPT
jgi:hypothetical protein